jgi:tRNA/rRNA methyltransferase
MSGAGTDRTKLAVSGGPVIVLVRPQLAENIGMAARAMMNFGLSELRLVAPRDGWPKKGAAQAASGAVAILNQAVLFDSLAEAVLDLNMLYATTARERGQLKPVHAADLALAEAERRIDAGLRVGIAFGPERTGLDNDEIALADALVTFPVNPAFASLNLAQAVLLVGYEWFKAAHLPERNVAAGQLAAGQGGPQQPAPASRAAVFSFFDYLEAELDACGFFAPTEKKPIMARNLRNIFHRLEMSEQDVRTLRGAVSALVEGRRGGRNQPRPSRRLAPADRGEGSEDGS